MHAAFQSSTNTQHATLQHAQHITRTKCGKYSAANANVQQTYTKIQRAASHRGF
jgi:hypothetical protein